MNEWMDGLIGWIDGSVDKWTIGRTLVCLSSDRSLKSRYMKYQAAAHSCAVTFAQFRLSQLSELRFAFVRVFRSDLPSACQPPHCIAERCCGLLKQYHMVSVRCLHSGTFLQRLYTNHGRSVFPREPHHPHSDYPALSLTHHQTEPLTTQPL
jgi:hypothetical protein